MSSVTPNEYEAAPAASGAKFCGCCLARGLHAVTERRPYRLDARDLEAIGGTNRAIGCRDRRRAQDAADNDVL
jgi:hypothetical protein